MNRVKLFIFFLSLVLPISMFYFDFFKILELNSFNLRFKFKKSIIESDKILHLNIDDESINNIGRWPWSRDKIATALEVLREFNPRQVIFDVEFTEKTSSFIESSRLENSLSDFLNYSFSYLEKNFISKNFQKKKKDFFIQNFLNFQQNELLTSVSNSLNNPDQSLSTSIKNLGNVYLTVRGAKQSNNIKKHILDTRLKWFDDISSKDPYIFKKNTPINFYDFDFVYPASDPIFRYAQGFGFTNAYNDTDHLLRKNPLFIKINGFLVPDLAFRPVLEYLKVLPENIILNKKGRILLKDAIMENGSKRDISIPINDNGEIIVNWVNSGWRDFFDHYNIGRLIEYKEIKTEFENSKNNLNELKTNPNSDISKSIISSIIINYPPSSKLQNHLLYAKSYLENVIIKNWEKDYNFLKKEINQKVSGKVCFVGLTASATSDLGSVPVDLNAPLVSARSNLYNTILQEDFLIDVPFYINIIALLFFSIFFSYVSSFIKKTIFIPFFGLFLVISYLALNFWFFSNGFVLNLVLVELSLFVNIFSDSIYRFINENKNKEFIKGAFGQYLSPKIIDQIMDDPDKIKLGGEKLNITAFFSDLEKFSSISEGMSPEKLVYFLNDYLTEMSNIVLGYDGVIDKYEGDAIIAFWGAPIKQKDHAVMACFCSLDMQERLRELSKDYKAKAGRDVNMRIGLNSGDAVVGNMGSSQRMDYTMMGDTVNLAARLEGANKFYNTYTMFSDMTYKKVSDKIEARKLDVVRVVGKDQPITIYQPISRKGAVNNMMSDVLNYYDKAYSFYQKRNFSDAVKFFEKAVKISPNDGPSIIMAKRSLEYIDNPPDDKWDGVFNFTSKG